MSACPVCGNEAVAGNLCAADMDAWLVSRENTRRFSLPLNDKRCDVAFVDFITRARAERQNGAKP